MHWCGGTNLLNCKKRLMYIDDIKLFAKREIIKDSYTNNQAIGLLSRVIANGHGDQSQ